MIDDAVVLLTFPDHETEKNGKTFTVSDGVVSEISYAELADAQCFYVCLEFKSVASEIVSRGHRLPSLVVDLEELIVATSLAQKVSEIRASIRLENLLRRFGAVDDDVARFQALNCNSLTFDEELLLRIGGAILRAFKVIARLAAIRQEWTRYIEVEAPVAIALYSDIMKGVPFDPDTLSKFRNEIEYDFFKALKDFSAKHDLPLEVPTSKDLEAILEGLGFDLENASVEFVLDFISMENGLGEDVQNLRRLRATRDALNGISHKKSTSYPQIDAQGTRTSRVLLKVPAIQNIPKKYREILVPRPSKAFSYVDYDQFEVGIMAALSGDPILLELYNQEDLYEAVSKSLFATEGMRKEAKRLFLSYAYGMRRKNLIDAAVNLGSSKQMAKSTFDQFVVFEAWKVDLAKRLAEDRRIGTRNGNYFHLQHKYAPTAKDIRSAVSQKVQGTGSLVFKMALLKLAKLDGFRIVLPMHDAVLVEHGLGDDPCKVVELFEGAMTDLFDGKIAGKASVSEFAV